MICKNNRLIFSLIIFLLWVCPFSFSAGVNHLPLSLDNKKNTDSNKIPVVIPGYLVPIIDLSAVKKYQVIVDKEDSVYLGHVTSVLLDDGKTIIAVYPKGHGKGEIVMKKSNDGGKTWSKRLPVPENWKTSKEVPTIFKTYDKNNKRRLIMFSGLYPIRMAVSDNDGKTWSGLKPIGDFGGIVAMSSMIELKTGQGHYMAMFHDDGRFIKSDGKNNDSMSLYKTFSYDGGLTWSNPEIIYKSSNIHLCEAGLLRSPDGKQIAALLRENKRVKNSHIIFSINEGQTWSEPAELPLTLTGDRHTAKYLKDGRLFISFRDLTPKSVSPTEGDWVGWVGTYDDILNKRNGQYRIRLMDNKNKWDCAYSGVEILKDDTIVTTTYGHWEENAKPYIVCVRFKPENIQKGLIIFKK
jgi:hypothetical protein